MTLDAIHAERFKCFDTLVMPVGQLTLLTGYNGAGKSSSLQPLLLMAQSMRFATGGSGLPLNGSLVRLGSASDVVSRIAGGDVALGFSGGGDFARWRFGYDRDHGFSELQFRDAEFSFAQGQAAPDNWRLKLDYSRPLIRSVRDLIYLTAVRQSRLDAFPSPDDPSAIVGDVGAEGEFAPFWYVQRADEEVNQERRHPTEARVTVRGQIDAWLSTIFPGASANAESLPGTSLNKLTFKMGRGSSWDRPSNVGFGLSYAFPLITALVTAAPGQIVVVDSPEAHLHPSAQSAMGRMLAHFAASGLQVIIESHSDHLLSGVRLAVKEKVIDPSAASISFFDRGERWDGGAAFIPIEIRSDGGISEWPKGFFDQGINDLVELS